MKKYIVTDLTEGTAFTNQTHTKTEQELREWAEEIRQNEGLQDVTPDYTEKYNSLDGLRREGYIEDIDECIEFLESCSDYDLEIVEETTTKKYIVIDTWNGEGYSSNNGTDIQVFDSKRKAMNYAKKRANEQYADKVWKDGDGYVFGVGEYEEGEFEDHGTYQVFELDDTIYAIEIMCNVNEVALLTKEMYEKELEQKEIQIKECIKECNNKRVFKGDYLINFTYDREEFVHESKDGNFYCDLDDYDYQYRILTK